MSLQATEIPPIPRETARIAKAAFPKGNIYIRMRDELGTIFDDSMFVAVFSRKGQPAICAWRLALITIMQFIEGLSDRQTADAVRARIDWKYVLALDLDDVGFDHSILCEFRARLITGGLEQTLLDSLLARFKDMGLLKARGKQRTDSTHILAAVRSLHRLELVGETLRAALNCLAVVAPDWLVEQVPSGWFDRYGVRIEQYRFPKKEEERKALADTIGCDGHLLLSAVYDTKALPWLRELDAVRTLRHVWVHQFFIENDTVLLRKVEDTAPSNMKIDSPYDVDARYSIKRDTTWSGYKSHITETCDADAPNFIINVETTLATVPDSASTSAIHDNLASRELLPSEHIVDSGYVDAELLVESRNNHDIDLMGPVLPDTSWQAKAELGFDTAAFMIDWDAKTATCPQGKITSNWNDEQDQYGNDRIDIKFDTLSCRKCPSRSNCTRSKNRPREITVRNKDQYEALQKRRREQMTEPWKLRYNLRSGIEGMLSQAVRRFNLRKSKYIGIVKTHLQHIFISIAVNVVRFDAWLTGQPRAKTRRSAFVLLQEFCV